MVGPTLTVTLPLGAGAGAGATNVNKLLVGLLPLCVVTTTLTGPAACNGVVQCKVVLLVTVIAVAAVLPILTPVTLTKLVPVMVTAVLPLVVPVFGLIPVTVGAGGLTVPSTGLAALAAANTTCSWVFNLIVSVIGCPSLLYNDIYC
jgi:hypothetical protein